MAAISSPPTGRYKDVFQSVFPAGSVRAPKQPHQFENTNKTNVGGTYAILKRDSRTVLGIEDEGFVFTTKTSRSVSVTPFYTYYPKCCSGSDLPSPSQQDHNHFVRRIQKLESWKSVPSWVERLGKPAVEKLLAEVSDSMMTEFVTWSYSNAYSISALPHLKFWVEYMFAVYLRHMLFRVNSESTAKNDRWQVELHRWQDMALARLAGLRVDELFEIVVNWDETAAGINELKHFLTSPATRTYVTNHFTNTLTRRLLHPGASTIEILQLYISIIRAFRQLDPRGVLLERVTRKLRHYLREREETVKIVVAGLLSELPDGSADPSRSDQNTLGELALELQQQGPDATRGGDSDLDWNNMQWLPDPVDAAPGYLKSKSTDIIGSVISILDSKEVFVQELQTALADRLLRNKPDFDQEIGVVEHLKLRFGDAAFQPCEVMLKDVLDSRKVNTVIRRDQGIDECDSGQDWQLHTKVLSRLFWPTLPAQEFKVPVAILEQQARFEKGFESLKQSRKLSWNNAVGQVRVELELEDRSFDDYVLPYQATVIYAFQDVDNVSPDRTVADLASELEMTPALVRSACVFWVSKRILKETSKDHFAILEMHPDGEDADGKDTHGGRQDTASAAAEAAAAAAQAEAAVIEAAKEAEEVVKKQKMAIYHQFIVSMLTNQGAMPMPRIAMMLGIVVPGGFPFSNEELKEFMAAMVHDGVLEMGPGGAYKVVT